MMTSKPSVSTPRGETGILSPTPTTMGGMESTTQTIQRLMSRRRSLVLSFAGLGAAILNPSGARAQMTEQEVRNGLQVTSTGDVEVDQAASGQQDVRVTVDGLPVTENGVYRTANGQTVVNDGQITSTGDVRVTQSASGTQSVYTAVYDGMPAESCNPGHVLADPKTGQLFFQGEDCCYWPACASECRKCRDC